jgi:predicted lipoprotein with Yx(FWY)xxD motif
MKTSTIVWIIIVLIIILGGGWYWYSMQQAAPATGPSTAMGLNGSANQGNLGQPDTGTVQQPGADGQEDPVIGSNLALGTDSNAKVGTYLIGYTGMTVYTYAKDTGSTSTCYDTCATNWPPYIVSPVDNIQQLKAGVTGAVGTTVRTDGQLQLTYNGKPLYFYAGDKTGSDVNGQGLGGVWYVVKP